MDKKEGLSRRAFLQSSGALVGGCLLGSAGSAQAATLLDLDFRGSLPYGVSFRRNSSASVADDDRVRFVPPDTPRFPLRQGAPQGLLIEGETKNLIAYASRPTGSGWASGGGVVVSPAAAELAPDGSPGVYRISRPEPTSGSRCEAVVPNPVGAEFGSGSVWLRTTGGTGKWRLRLLDFNTYSNVSAVVEVGPEWRRYSLSMYQQSRDTGSKRFSVLWNEPFGPEPAPAIYVLKRPIAYSYEPVRTPLTLSHVLMWGAQYESDSEPSSFVATAGAVASRAADVATFSTTLLNTAGVGRLTIVLPEGGRRGAVLLDAPGPYNSGGLRLAYSNSGWIVARVGWMRVAGFGDVSADTVVQVEWSWAGVQVFTGTSPQSLTLRAAVRGNPMPLRCGPVARLGMATDGKRPLNRVLARLTFSNEVSAMGKVALPNFIPALYYLSFSDEFNNPDVSRINENATGGRAGAPAWRSRYRHERRTVVNQEKQIYMDPQFAGTAERPLGVQPFSIVNGVLRIRAERADPVAVSPFIWNYAYTSGCITTELTHWQTYGYFEMRARLPRGKGFWPAFWLLPKSAAWPPEIDIFEASGMRPYGVRHGAIEKPRNAATATAAWVDQIIDTSEDFHIYGMEWTRDNIVFFIDGMKSFEYGPHNIHKDMYLLANLALGSHDPNWIPNPDATTPFPGLFEIDYIRAYRRSA